MIDKKECTLYRAQDKNGAWWISESIVFNTSRTQAAFVWMAGAPLPTSAPLSNISTLVNIETLGKYTTMNTHDGEDAKKIFQGDLIAPKCYPFYGDDDGACKELNYVGEVYFDEDELQWCYALHVVSDRVRGGAVGDTLCSLGDQEIHILGNIHDNKELINHPKNL